MKKYLLICFIISVLCAVSSCTPSISSSKDGDFKKYYSKYKQDNKLSKELTQKN